MYMFTLILYCKVCFINKSIVYRSLFCTHDISNVLRYVLRDGAVAVLDWRGLCQYNWSMSSGGGL